MSGKSIHRVAVLLAVATMCLSAGAQVHRCTTSSGQTVYQDEPCKGGRTLEVDQLRANTLNSGPKLGDWPAAPLSDQSRALVVGNGVRCATPQELRNIEVTASSNAISQLGQERAFLQGELARARSCTRAHRYTEKDWRDLWTLHAFQTRMDPRDRAKARQEALSIHDRARP